MRILIEGRHFYDVLTEKKNIVNVIILTIIASLGGVLFLGAGFTVASILSSNYVKQKKIGKKLSSVNRYKYLEDLFRYFEAAFAENQDTKRIRDKSFEKKSQLKTGFFERFLL